MNALFLLLFLVSIVCLIVGLIQPKIFSRFFKDKASRKFVGLVFGIATVLFFILFGVTSTPSTNKSDNSAPKTETKTTDTGDQAKVSEEAAKKTVPAPKYEFVKTKTETTDGNKMDLYTYSSSLNLDELKALCKENKPKFTSGKFYYLVVFDSTENAVFPKDPFTAEYGMEEVPKKHIKAMYTYNRINGYSKLVYYDSNSWEGTAKTEEI